MVKGNDIFAWLHLYIDERHGSYISLMNHGDPAEWITTILSDSIIYECFKMIYSHCQYMSIHRNRPSEPVVLNSNEILQGRNMYGS